MDNIQRKYKNKRLVFDKDSRSGRKERDGREVKEFKIPGFTNCLNTRD